MISLSMNAFEPADTIFLMVLFRWIATMVALSVEPLLNWVK